MALLAIGTYTQMMPHVAGKGTGIYTGRFDETTGRVTAVHTTPHITNPSYLAYDPNRRVLYAVQETDEPETSAIAAYQVDGKTGGLRFLNQRSAQGSAPCYLSMDGAGRFVLGANFVSGNVAVFPVAEDGRLQSASHVIQHPGSEPHAHMSVPDPANQFVLAVDLGVDKLFTYRLDGTTGTLTHHAETILPAGSGPRHLAFHPNGRTLFVIHEFTSLITTWAYGHGRLTHLHTISTLPDGFEGKNATAAIRVSADGRFVYASNRGHDTLAVFAFAAQSNDLRLLAHVPVHGRTPRDFVLDPTGHFLLVANQDSDNIVTFRLNLQTGLPVETVNELEIPTPVCLQFMN